MAPEVQRDDVVLGRSLQPTHEPPQLVRRQLSEAWTMQLYLTRELLTASGGKRKLQVAFEGCDCRITGTTISSKRMHAREGARVGRLLNSGMKEEWKERA
jgi:hypothetical protein